ncbi:hypothetical protein Pfo_005921 [Paulownia fortunei]|nr:hypothetical protein Pfo_005921 [Paulownia fortunei]
MHAVVLLYNYHHKKQKPELIFLDFVYFCKLAVVVRPPLIAFMKLMMEGESMELNGAEDQLSVTEKAIKDACNIAVALDASRDVPNTEGWPISKVAVLLIDSKKENCMLQFGAVTKGVWSLIEKELNESSINPEISSEDKVGNKRKRKSQKASTYDTKFLQLAYDAVKDVTGIDSSDLEILETHVTYSLSKEKSAARFYMMQCPGSFNVNEQVPLNFLVESLHGPLAEKLAYGFWKTTPVVEFHHMLPYVEFISCWLSGKDLCLPSFNGCNAQSTMNSYKNELTQSRTSDLPVSKDNGNDLNHRDNNSSGTKNNSSDKTASENCDSNKCKHSSGGKLASPVNIFQSTAKDGNVTDNFNKRCDILDSAKYSGSRILENLANDSEQPDKVSGSDPSRGLSQRMVKVDNAMEKFNKRCDVADTTKEASRISLEILDTDSDDQQKSLLSGPSRGLSGKTVIDDNVTEKSNKNHDIAHFAEREESRIYPEILDKDDECDKDSLSGSSRGLKTMNMSDLTKTCTMSEDTSMKLNSKIRVYHHRRKNNSSTQNDAHAQEDGASLKVDMVDSLKSFHTQCRDEKISGDKGDVTISCNQKGIAATRSELVQFEAKTKYNVEVQRVSASEELQNALSLLYRKRQELYSQICNMEDTLALYEDNIARIRDGGEVGLACQCIKSIISGNYHMLLEHGTQNQDKGHQRGEDNLKSQHEKQTRLSETYLPGKSSCQDLEYICLKNNWRLPRYLIEASEGEFLSNVIVEGKDFKLHSKGGFESKPCEARESAATQMIAKMRNS